MNQVAVCLFRSCACIKSSLSINSRESIGLDDPGEKHCLDRITKFRCDFLKTRGSDRLLTQSHSDSSHPILPWAPTMTKLRLRI